MMSTALIVVARAATAPDLSGAVACSIVAPNAKLQAAEKGNRDMLDWSNPHPRARCRHPCGGPAPQADQTGLGDIDRRGGRVATSG
jgi:hypothetical protein